MREELSAIQDRLLLIAGGSLLGVLGLVLSVWTSEPVRNVILDYGGLIGPGMVALGTIVVLWKTLRRRAPDKETDRNP